MKDGMVMEWVRQPPGEMSRQMWPISPHYSSPRIWFFKNQLEALGGQAPTADVSICHAKPSYPLP
jgi:hypothetical protein